MLAEVKQPLAWELRGDLWDLVRIRPYMQQEEWEFRFAEFWPHQQKDLSQSEARQEMFDLFSSNGLAQRHYASELDVLIANNEGWQAKIADLCLVCSAFPVCDIGVCHHRSIGHRKGYEDKNGRLVPSHQVRSFFSHRGQLSASLKDVHKAAIAQLNHDTAIDMMMSHLLGHKSGFYIIDRCSKCKKDFEALRIERPGEYKAKHREYDNQGSLKFEYDIGLIDEDGSLKAILEALNTHKMGADKRKYADSKGYPWIEYSVIAMLSSHQKGSVHSRAGGWLELEARKLKIGYSGDPFCPTCSEEIERERAAADRREKVRRRITEGEEVRRKAMKELVEPAERELNQISETVESINLGFSITSLNNMEVELANAEMFVREIEDRLREAEQVTVQLHEIESEVAVETASRKDKSFCSKTGLELATEGNELLMGGFQRFSVRVDEANCICRDLFTRIELKREELISLREWCQ